VQFRIARHTDRLDEVVRLHRDGLGVAELGRFRGHAAYPESLLCAISVWGTA
jgi:hypothetical protein